MIQSLLTFDSIDRTLKCNIHWKAVEQYFTVVPFVNFNFTLLVIKVLENLSILDLALSAVKGLFTISSYGLKNGRKWLENKAAQEPPPMVQPPFY